MQSETHSRLKLIRKSWEFEKSWRFSSNFENIRASIWFHFDEKFHFNVDTFAWCKTSINLLHSRTINHSISNYQNFFLFNCCEENYSVSLKTFTSEPTTEDTKLVSNLFTGLNQIMTFAVTRRTLCLQCFRGHHLNVWIPRTALLSDSSASISILVAFFSPFILHSPVSHKSRELNPL